MVQLGPGDSQGPSPYTRERYPQIPQSQVGPPVEGTGLPLTSGLSLLRYSAVCTPASLRLG